MQETLLEFPDNRLLIDLCGEFDRNLAQIEEQLGVQIVHQGNQLACSARPDSRGQAARCCNALHALEPGGPIDAG